MKLCAHCSCVMTKRWANKYCSHACSCDARRRVLPSLVTALRKQGMTYPEIELFVHATAGAIRKAMSRHRSAA